MRLPILCLPLPVLGLLLASALSDPVALAQNPANEIDEFMRAKLIHSQKVLEGLTTENFELIAINSQAISLLSRDESWQVLQTPEYLSRSVEFRRTVDALTAAAKQKNLDGAALAYIDVTLKCVECHKYVRRLRP